MSAMITNFFKKQTCLIGRQVQKQKKRIFRKLSHSLFFGEKVIMSIACLAMILDMLFPQVVLAGSEKTECLAVPQIYCVENINLYTEPLEMSGDKLTQIFYITVTAYSSTPDQTDSTPFITANNTRVHDGVAAANFLPFKTKIKFPEIFGDKIFTIEDRMNRRFSDRIDIWMPSRAEARKFGMKKIKVEVLDNEITMK
jgi:3D (Asp-Asp-Asp) domain-containing protein